MKKSSPQKRQKTGRRAARRTAVSAGRNPKARKRPADVDAQWLTPSAFLRWMAQQGVTLSRKSLYKTYYGRGARHPLHVSPDGKRIHREKGLELIRLVHGGEGTGETDRLIRERLAAEARHRAARARMAELELEESLGTRVPIAIVEKIWAEMIEGVKGETRTAANNLPLELEGKSKGEMRAVLAVRFHEIFKGLATVCREKAKAAAAAARTAA